MDPIVGTNQSSKQYNARIAEKFRAKAPKTFPEGTWLDRNGDTVAHYARDSIRAKCLKFNASLRLTAQSQPSGVDDKQKLNMAYAHYAKKTTNPADYEYRDFDIEKWNMYGAWKLLKDTGYFESQASKQLAPSPNADNVIEKQETRPIGNKRAKDLQLIQKRQAFREQRAQKWEHECKKLAEQMEKRAQTSLEMSAIMKENQAKFIKACEAYTSAKKVKGIKRLMSLERDKKKKQRLTELLHKETLKQLESEGIDLSEFY